MPDVDIYNADALMLLWMYPTLLNLLCLQSILDLVFCKNAVPSFTHSVPHCCSGVAHRRKAEARETTRRAGQETNRACLGGKSRIVLCSRFECVPSTSVHSFAILANIALREDVGTFESNFGIQADRPILHLEEFDHLLKDVRCNGPVMSITLLSSHVYEKARAACAGLKGGLLISSHFSCSEGHEHSYYRY